MKPFTFAQWLNEGKSMTAEVDASRRVYRWDSLGGPAAARCLARTARRRTTPNWARPMTSRTRTRAIYRRMPINYGLYNSINTATFASATQLDFCGIQKMVDAVGLHSGLDGAPINMHQLGNLLGAISVAPLHMANAFATFANDGKYCVPIALLEVTDAAGGKLPAQAGECRDAVKPDVARGVNSVLQDV